MTMTQKELKDKYKNEYQRIKGLVNNFDPCGLIHSGAPEDEYDCLTNQLISLTIKGATIEKLKSLIINEMTDHFGVDIPTIEPYKSKFQKDLHDFTLNVRQLDKDELGTF
jgi:hypothetical protein